jgi:hypothetical protein
MNAMGHLHARFLKTRGTWDFRRPGTRFQDEEARNTCFVDMGL